MIFLDTTFIPFSVSFYYMLNTYFNIIRGDTANFYIFLRLIRTAGLTAPGLLLDLILSCVSNRVTAKFAFYVMLLALSLFDKPLPISRARHDLRQLPVIFH